MRKRCRRERGPCVGATHGGVLPSRTDVSDAQTMTSSISFLSEMHSALADDVAAHRDGSGPGGRPHEVRAFVRSAFACIEGTLFAMRNEIIHDADARQRLSHPEFLCLSEEAHFVDERGRAKSRPVFLSPLASSLRFTFRCFAKGHGFDFQPDFNNAGWTALLQAAELRNRLTHPKGVADLNVGKQEFFLMVHADVWFSLTFVGAILANIGELRRQMCLHADERRRADPSFRLQPQFVEEEDVVVPRLRDDLARYTTVLDDIVRLRRKLTAESS